ncbi:MAG: DUF3871 family protein [Bacteroidetes bacterium]|uniref:DUF3871 family protein n=1 Tax=Phnomibacter sp. TaxID=2836217 RepID=UPI002FDED8D6|nr:DUF3871 family protein [Bacteroidota bacterium]
MNNNHLPVLDSRQYSTAFEDEHQSTSRPFIEANTIQASLADIRKNHIIPVFVKDNQTLISHVEFIDTAFDVASDLFHGEIIMKPAIRLSHPIKGRIPSAKDKSANELYEHEKTIYYERMAFVIEVPSIQSDIMGNSLSLTIGGVKSYSLDNLYSRKGADEHFKMFIGFQNKVCTNLCVWSDGFVSDLKVGSLSQLKASIYGMIENYNHKWHLENLNKLSQYSLTEQQFAQLIGRCRMYPNLPANLRKEIPNLLLTDTQMNMVVRDYYRDKSFCRDAQGNINMWKLYNLFTEANKSSYIDQFLDRSVNSFEFVDEITSHLETSSSSWYLN